MPFIFAEDHSQLSSAGGYAPRMRIRFPFPGWLWPGRTPEPMLESWRAALTEYTLRVIALGAAVTLAGVLISYWPRPAPPTLWLVVACYAGALLLLTYVRGSVRVRAGILLSTFLFIAPFVFASFGPGPAGFLCLLCGCVLAALLVGPRTAGGFLLVSIGLVALGAWAHARGLGMPRPHSPQVAAAEGMKWIRQGIVWLSMTGWLVYVTSWLTLRFESALRSKDEALRRAEVESMRRARSDVQREATVSSLIEAQKHEAMARVAGGVSHDFNNALFVILGWNDLLRQDGVSEAQRGQGHAAIANAGHNAAELARKLVTMGRQRSGPPHLTHLLPLLEESMRFLSRLLPEDIRVTAELEEVPAVSIDPVQIQQVVLNLALNGRDSMPRGGPLRVALRPLPAGEHAAARGAVDEVLIEVRDSGHGLIEPAPTTLFESWPDGSADTAAAHLGLATTHAIVQRAGGRIEVEREPGKGATFRVILPVARAGPIAADAVPARAAQRGSVLVVEDDGPVRELIVLALRSHGHRVREAADGDQALRMLDEPGVEDDLLCIDGVLPGAPTTTIIERFRAVRPGCPVLVCSGHLSTPQLQALVQDERLPFLAKPFLPAELAAMVEELLCGHAREHAR